MEADTVVLAGVVVAGVVVAGVVAVPFPLVPTNDCTCSRAGVIEIRLERAWGQSMDWPSTLVRRAFPWGEAASAAPTWLVWGICEFGVRLLYLRAFHSF